MIAIRIDAKKVESFLQQGLREHLLCEGCETRLSVWEKHASAIFRPDQIDLALKNSEGWTEVQADYRSFKLYTMSLIWRMGISSIPCFGGVQLGIKHEERLRQSLLKGEPLTPDDYPVVICAVSISDEWLPEWITPPYPGEFHGVHTYASIIGGFMHCFFVGSKPIHRHLKPLVLQSDGGFKIAHRKVQDIPFLLKMVEEIRDTLNRST